MPGGRLDKVGDFAFDVDKGEALFEQIMHLLVELSDAEDRLFFQVVFHASRIADLSCVVEVFVVCLYVESCYFTSSRMLPRLPSVLEATFDHICC